MSSSASAVPQDLRDSKIVILYKNKNRNNCNNYCRISLLNIVGKLFAVSPVLDSTS